MVSSDMSRSAAGPLLRGVPRRGGGLAAQQMREREDSAAGGVGTCDHRHHDEHDEHRQPVRVMMVDVPPHDGEQHCADEHHDVAPAAPIACPA